VTVAPASCPPGLRAWYDRLLVATPEEVAPAEPPQRVAAPSDAATVPLRLTVARGRLGIELYEPVEVGPLEVAALSLSLPDLRFPLDLSGGVRTFRNRRGLLEHLELRIVPGALARWLTERWRDVLGGVSRPVAVWSTGSGFGFGALGADGAVAFELRWAPDGGDARWVITRARAAGVRAPALVLAFQLVDTALAGVSERRGRLVCLPEVGRSLGRLILPAVGARAPSARGLRFGPLEARGDALVTPLDTALPPMALDADTARALELARLTTEADEALARGDIEDARARFMAVLEHAPRHPEVVRTVAEIDHLAEGRAEAPLSMLAESLSVSEFGAVGAELLAVVGDLEGARHALRTATDGEPYGPIAALGWVRLAELSPSVPRALEALDEAVARAPALARARFARLAARLSVGDVGGALADAEHLEAAASGSRARYAVCRQAADALLSQGFVRDAGRLFERALRYVPDDAEATAGLARSFLELGKIDRAAGLLERAIHLGARAAGAPPEALVDLGRLLAERYGDLPGGIARVREVPAGTSRAALARYLEATWRARLGDLAGAALAYGRLRDMLTLGAEAEPREAAAWLLEAARFAAEESWDVLSAERHLALAVQLRPHDPAIGEAYRAMSSRARVSPAG
jgi:cellulose synthase operon protein C